MGLGFAVDPQAVLDPELAAPAAELPDGAAADAEQGALPVGGAGDFNRGRKVEADSEIPASGRRS
jgi:hypothetical protein